VVGQVVGYGNNAEDEEYAVRAHTYGSFEERLRSLTRATTPLDPRFREELVVPWAFAWTGLIAIRTDAVREYGLYFDEEFEGWGVDDLEWGFRVSASGIRIQLEADVRALHLPHARDAEFNRRTERLNYRRFLRKWPCPDVELAAAFGDVAANSWSRAYRAEVTGITGAEGDSLGTLRGQRNGRTVACVGVVLARDGTVRERATLLGFDSPERRTPP
jgi:hypothetical protein